MKDVIGPKMDRKELIEWILKMRQADENYAREALRWYHAMLPWLDLFDGVKVAINEQSTTRQRQARATRGPPHAAKPGL